VEDSKVLIEQSFSDFGDADSLLLIDGSQGKQSIFIEAKVKTFQSKYWSIEDEFRVFQVGIEEKKKVSSSNLYVQLYYKQRLVRELQKGNENWRDMELDFPESLLSASKKKRKIGSNEVVLKAVDLLRQYCSKAYFVALVPEDGFKLRHFYEGVLKDFKPEELPEWDVKDWGYVSWKQVEDFCEKHSLRGVLNVFEFNNGQIY
jgi:hypothetical protein